MGEEENNRDSPMSGEEATTDLTVVTRLYDTNRTIREVILYIHFTYVILTPCRRVTEISECNKLW